MSNWLRALFLSQKTSNSLKNVLIKLHFYVRLKKVFCKFFLQNKRYTHSLFGKEQCERVAQVTHDKRATMSESLRLLTKNEQPWDIGLGRSPKMSNREIFAQVAHQKWKNEQIAHFFERIAHLLIFSQKTSDSLRKPMKEFPILLKSYLTFG